MINVVAFVVVQDVINGAYSSTVTKKSKKQAWEEVVAAVSSECPHATPKTLKDARKKWSNTLCEVRKAIGLYKKSIRGTGVKICTCSVVHLIPNFQNLQEVVIHLY